jgi:hypothetical protein
MSTDKEKNNLEETSRTFRSGYFRRDPGLKARLVTNTRPTANSIKSTSEFIFLSVTIGAPSVAKFFAIGIVALLTGCITHPQHPSATQPATAIDLATTQPSYWMDQPPIGVVSSADFDKLWKVSEDVARSYLFKLDREDYRMGILTTEPLVSAQWFEPWRRDNRTPYDVEESSIASIRRTITFQFKRTDDGIWQVAPKVLIERQSISEKRITSVVLYRNVFTEQAAVHNRPSGTPESDVGIILPERYWYPLRRDTDFERVLMRALQNRLDGR